MHCKMLLQLRTFLIMFHKQGYLTSIIIYSFLSEEQINNIFMCVSKGVVYREWLTTCQPTSMSRVMGR